MAPEAQFIGTTKDHFGSVLDGMTPGMRALVTMPLDREVPDNKIRVVALCACGVAAFADGDATDDSMLWASTEASKLLDTHACPRWPSPDCHSLTAQ